MRKTMSDRFTIPIVVFIMIPSLVIAFSGLSLPVQVRQTHIGRRQQQQQLLFKDNDNIIGNSQFAMINECRQRLDIIATTTTTTITSTQLYSAQSPPDDTPKPITSESISQSSSLSSDSDSTDIDGNNNSIVDDVDNPNSGGISRTVLLALPLFFKFAIVLIIKFLTDLVVFPLLFAWRGCRIGKRRLLRLFGIIDTSHSNNINNKTKLNSNNKDSFDPDLRLNGDGI